MITQEEIEKVLAMTPQEMVENGFNPMGVDTLRKMLKEEIDPERVHQKLKDMNKPVNINRDKISKFEKVMDEKEELTRRDKRMLRKRYTKQLKRGK